MKMLSGTRTETIKEILKQKKTVSVDELSRRFSVSPSTVRRDFKLLESAHFIRRTHGGAIRWETALDPARPQEKESYREISRIAKLALSVIKTDDTIYLDGGVITLILARLLKENMFLNVITNSVKIAFELAARPQINLTLTGGNLKFPELTLQGPLSETILGQLHINKSFIDGVAVESEKGLTTGDVLSARMKQIMIDKADKAFVLAAAKHFGEISFASVCPLSKINSIITNKRLSNKIMGRFHQHKVNIMWG